MNDTVGLVLIGIGGYGEVYLSALLDEPEGRGCILAGAVDPRPDNCSRLSELETRGVPIHSSLDHFFRNTSADLAVISSPIHRHTEQTCQALGRGVHVLVEKPAAAVTADVDVMIEARARSDCFVAVGFQWSFARSILDLKRDILAGEFGAPLSARSLTLWPRTESYYARNDWAGRRRDADGRWILDSPASNAMGHDLHNMLFLLGPEMDRSAEPVEVTARLWRANDIETYDTVAARVRTANRTELLFLASHATAEDEIVDPRFTLEFESATVCFDGDGSPIIARHHDGCVVNYPSPNATSQVAKLWQCVDGCRSEPRFHCGLEAARPHAACIEAIENSGVVPRTFPTQRLHVSDTVAGRLHWVEGLASAFEASYASGEWPDLPWR